MGRGVSSGGGESSLGYLFGPEKAAAQPKAPQAGSAQSTVLQKDPPSVVNHPPVASAGRNTNNYCNAEGKNIRNFISDRPSTKVHSAPGGGSSLGYLFGGT